MTDLLVRGLSAEALSRLTHAAALMGLSRNEYLRRQVEGDGATPAGESSAVAGAKDDAAPAD
ncbi:MAG: hypothetical protein LBE08_10470 [Bifidobacteriaceae bacterium]|jgi:hypothetical protein|nr:hypothetical protein [Bifidobacteriaceae bacterium]